MIETKYVGFWQPNNGPSLVSTVDILTKQGVAAALLAHAQKLLPNEAKYPNVRDMIDPSWRGEERDAVIAYLLRRGYVRMAYLGWSTCRICGCENGTKDMTDGVYVWPEGFAHYLIAHEVKPPVEFIQHVMSRR
jgi:hypothetical protein